MLRHWHLVKSLSTFTCLSDTDDLMEAAVQIYLSTQDATDPIVQNQTDGGNMSLLPLLARGVIRPYTLIGHMFTAVDGNDDLVGFLMFTPPGEELLSSEEQRQLGYNTYFDALSEEGRAYFTKTLKESGKFVDDSLGMTSASLNCYWCDFAFVRPDYQGKGVATALFKLASTKARKAGPVKIGLQTLRDKNIPIYQHIGLKLKGRTVKSSPYGDWPMIVFGKDL